MVEFETVWEEAVMIYWFYNPGISLDGVKVKNTLSRYLVSRLRYELGID
jgi:hypothetical protein